MTRRAGHVPHESARLVRESARAYRRDLGRLLGVALVVFLPTAALAVILGAEAEIEDGTDAATALATLGQVVLAAGATLLGSFFYIGVVESTVTAGRAGEPRPALGATARELPYVRLIVADAMLVLGVGLGLALLIVPGIVLLTWFGFTTVVLTLEDRGIRSSLGRSRRLVRGSFAPVAVVLTALLGLDWLVTLALDLLLGAAGVSAALGDAVSSLTSNLLVAPVEAVVLIVIALELVERERASRPEARAGTRPA